MWALAVAFAIALAATPLVAAGARVAGLVDRPGALKVHDRPIPLLGGLAVIAAWVVGATVVGPTPEGSVLLAVALVFSVGFLDDVRTVPPAARLIVQFFAGAALVWGGARFKAVSPFASLMPVVAVLVATNGVNLVDGLDGLAAGCAALTAAGLAVIASGVGSAEAASATLALAGALVGFLVWNRRPARVFLGDAGAYAIGVTLVALAAAGTREAGIRDVAAAAMCFGVFIVEPVDSVRRRLRTSSAMTAGDRDHVYDRLISRGLTVNQTVSLVWATQAWLVVTAILLARVPAALPAAAVVPLGLLIPAIRHRLAAAALRGRPVAR